MSGDTDAEAVEEAVRVWLVERTYSDDVSASEASRGSGARQRSR